MAITMSSEDSERVERHPFGEIDTNSSIQPVLTKTSQTLPSSTAFPSIDAKPLHTESTDSHDPSSSINMPSPGRQSSAGSITSSIPSASSLASLQGQAMLPPTLGSALGINASSTHSSSSSSFTSTATHYIAPRKGIRSSGKQSSHTNSVPPPVWARRPSLPSMPSMGNRMSVASIASFDSLPEGESVPRFSVSPLGKTSHQSQHQVTSAEEEGIAGPSALAGPSLESSAAKASPPLEDFKKRKHLAMELLSTEHAYVTSLRLINDAYYQPLAALSRGVPSSKVESMSTASPILSRKAINEIFSNFVDILHLNQELFSRLDDRLSGRSRNTPSSRPASMATSSTSDSLQFEDQTKPWDSKTDSIGDLLVPMAPFLKMYSLYVKNFSSALARIESERKSNDSFARFLRETEKATWGRAGGFGYGLGFQAHLLTIVQRIPRYQLLVGDLVKCTPPSHKDYADLTKAYAVIEKVAESINDNIRQHEVVVVMLGLQRSLVGLSEPLIIPGRSLLKRGPLLKACRKNIQAREFFLFTDCLVYAAPISGSIDAASAASAAWQAFSRYGSSEALVTSPTSGPASPKISERPSYLSDSRAYGSSDNIRTRIRTMSGPSPYDSKRTSMSLENQQLQFRGKFSLQDCTVVAVDDVVSPEPWLRHCLEIRTPGKSFAVYAETLELKLQWLSAIRNAREEWVSNRRTLHAEEDSIQAKRDRRRSLQVGITSQRSFAPVRKSSIVMDNPSTSSIPEGEGSEMMREVLSQASSSTVSIIPSESHQQGSDKTKALKVLEEYNAPVWVPDSRADRCACCNEQFGIWRRKHHCRLCGQVVCWACSSKTFLIASYEEGEEDRPARACDVCYESVFPEPAELSVFLDHQKAPETIAVDDNKPAMGRPDSEVSLNTPSTPTSPALMQVDNEDYNDCLEGGSELDEGMSALFVASNAAPPPLPRRSSNKIGARFAKATGAADLQLFTHGNLLSPQVQAATSGLGTFRLVTPRLTTPEGEQAGSASANNMTRSSSNVAVGNDYFSGVQLDQSDSHNPQIPRLKRKKPLSAAARLSSVYGGLTSPSLTIPSK